MILRRPLYSRKRTKDDMVTRPNPYKQRRSIVPSHERVKVVAELMKTGGRKRKSRQEAGLPKAADDGSA